MSDGASGQPVAGAAVLIDGIGQTTSAADGTFAFTTAEPAAVRRVTVTSSSTVDRVAWAQVPGAIPALPLMPAVLSLDAFEQMFRGNGGVLRRWTVTPRLVIQTRVLRFTTTGAPSYVAAAGTLTPAEVDALLSDLAWALPQLSGGSMGAFSDVQIETAAEGQTVTVSRTGAVFVARFDGLSAATTFWGYSRWAWNAAGAIQAGITMLDQGFETSGSAFRRSLRAHELGHALGYNHVTSTSSVMISAARTEPTSFDRDASRIAFVRPLLNRFPDTDPTPGSAVSATGALTWAGAP